MNRAEILDEAKAAITVDRQQTHGKPENNFATIAAIWAARLGVSITPAQVAIMLVDLKTVRAWGNPRHNDNWVDIAGYAACGGELATLPRNGATDAVAAPGNGQVDAGLGDGSQTIHIASGGSLLRYAE